MAEAIGMFPIGTLDELKALGLNRATTPSCAPQDSDTRGCSYHANCRFRLYRDQIGGRIGPERFGYHKVLDVDRPEEEANGIISECYQIMQTEHQMMRQADEIGRLYSDFVAPGGTVRRHWREKLHVTKDPTCQACQTNTCQKMVEITKDVLVTPFVRPAERFGSARAFIDKIKDQSRESIDFERRVGAISHKPLGVVEAEPPAPSAKSPKTLKDQLANG